MKTKTFKIKRLAYILLIILTVFSSCKKDKQNIVPDPLPNISGFWIVTETVTGDCSGSIGSEEETEIFYVKQTNNDLTVIFYPGCDTIHGSITGNKISWEGTIPSGSGNIDQSFTGTISSDGTSGSGSATWEWYSDTYTCSGTTEITAEIVKAETANFVGTWNGSWQNEDNDITGTFTAVVNQSDTILTGTIEIPEIGMSSTNLTGFVSGNIVFFGDINNEIQFVGILNANSAEGNYIYPDVYDEGYWNASKIR